jgi:gliding motility associated protien GldN
MKTISTLLGVILAAQCSAQICNEPQFLSEHLIIDPAFQENPVTKRLVPYEFVREADVVWSKRIWRFIDLREKMNRNLMYPLDRHAPSGQYQVNSRSWSLWTILRHHVLNGDLTLFSAYNPYQFDMLDGDQFKYPIKPLPGKNFCTDSVFRDKAIYYFAELGPDPTIPISTVDGMDSTRRLPNGDFEFVYPPRDTFWFDSDRIIQYRLKEYWFFDKERSVMDVRIIGIAPVIQSMQINPDGSRSIAGTQELFWIYFPHLRYVLANYPVWNEQNDAQWMSYDDYFQKRRFSSVVYKESNAFDRSIESYKTGIDALIESEYIQDEIRNFEHDVWNF